MATKLENIKWVDGSALEDLELWGITPTLGMVRQADQEFHGGDTNMAGVLLNAIELQLEEVSKTLLRLHGEARDNPGDPRLYRLKALASDMVNIINSEKPEPETESKEEAEGATNTEYEGRE